MVDLFTVHKDMSETEVQETIDKWVCEEVDEMKKMMIRHMDEYAKSQGITFYEAALSILEQESNR